MNIWVKSILIGLAAAALAFLFIHGNNQKKTLYTMHYIIQLTPDEALSNAQQVDAVVNLPLILKRRCEAAGYSIQIKPLGYENQLKIDLDHVDDTDRAALLLTASNKLEFREVYSLPELANCFSSSEAAAKKFFAKNPAADSSSAFKSDHIGSVIFFSIDERGTIADNGTIGVALKKDTGLISRILGDTEVLKSFPRDVEFLYGPRDNVGVKDKEKFLNIYAIRTKMQRALLGNIDIIEANAEKGYNGTPQIVFQFSNGGARMWENMTRTNKGRCIAIILDKKVISAPRVIDVITGGNVSLSGGFTWEEAENLARHLNAGHVPIQLSILKQEIGPEKPASGVRGLLISSIVLLVVAGLSFLIFNGLRNK